jgi:hypothetical protein
MRPLLAALSVLLVASPAAQARWRPPKVGNPGRISVAKLVDTDPARAERLKELIKAQQWRNAHRVFDRSVPFDFEYKGMRFAYGKTFHHAQKFAALGTKRLLFASLDPVVQSYLKGGIFDPASYGGNGEFPTIYRASHGVPNPPIPGTFLADERGRDVTGAAWLWQVGTPNGPKEWQALSTTGPARAQFFPNGLHFAEFFDALSTGKEPGVLKLSREGKRAKWAAIKSIPQRIGKWNSVRGVAKLAAGTMTAGDLMRTTTESSAAIQVGRWGNVPEALRPKGVQADAPIVARFALVPRYRPYSQSLISRFARGVGYRFRNRDDLYQRRLAARALAAGPVGFDLELQFFRDPVSTPLNDSSKPWSRFLAKPVKVATIELDKQEIDVERGSDFEWAVYDHSSFGPQVRAKNIEVEALPAGQMAQDRDVPYETSSGQRHADNDKLLQWLQPR